MVVIFESEKFAEGFFIGTELLILFEFLTILIVILVYGFVK